MPFPFPDNPFFNLRSLGDHRLPVHKSLKMNDLRFSRVTSGNDFAISCLRSHRCPGMCLFWQCNKVIRFLTPTHYRLSVFASTLIKHFFGKPSHWDESILIGYLLCCYEKDEGVSENLLLYYLPDNSGEHSSCHICSRLNPQTTPTYAHWKPHRSLWVPFFIKLLNKTTPTSSGTKKLNTIDPGGFWSIS